MVFLFLFFFFFQAEDGIRDTSVTGVQTCALPICSIIRHSAALCKRRNRSRVANDRAAVTRAAAAGATAQDRAAGGGQRFVLHRAGGLSVANVAGRFSTLLDGPALFLWVARRRHVATDQLRTAAARARGGAPWA